MSICGTCGNYHPDKLFYGESIGRCTELNKIVEYNSEKCTNGCGSYILKERGRDE